MTPYPEAIEMQRKRGRGRGSIDLLGRIGHVRVRAYLESSQGCGTPGGVPILPQAYSPGSVNWPTCVLSAMLGWKGNRGTVVLLEARMVVQEGFSGPRGYCVASGASGTRKAPAVE